ncbi:MAG: hypothetical protein JNK79_00175 [Chitinophagaceae bacterium]|nr:hypothetical protein [Chitinophagaceae bacterium]
MPFVFLILIRILFVACMVFILGYVFGNFSRSKSLTTITRIASVVAIVLFIAANALLFRFAGWRHGEHGHRQHYEMQCDQKKDSLDNSY